MFDATASSTAWVADIVGERAQYIKNKAMDNDYYTRLIINYLKQYKKGKRNDFVELLTDKLSDVLDQKQKENKIRIFSQR
jgi:ATP-dependent DNA helicase RecG